MTGTCKAVVSSCFIGLRVRRNITVRIYVWWPDNQPRPISFSGLAWLSSLPSTSSLPPLSWPSPSPLGCSALPTGPPTPSTATPQLSPSCPRPRRLPPSLTRATPHSQGLWTDSLLTSTTELTSNIRTYRHTCYKVEVDVDLLLYNCSQSRALDVFQT